MHAQCTNKLSHISGTQLVAGVNVTVTSVGNTCSWTTYCFGITDPYMIGYAPGPGSGPGALTFTFSPAVDGLRFNFSGASGSGASTEEIRLAINGAHYPMSSAGAPNACDAMAILTGAGDLQGVGGVSGWANTNISGFPITTLTVEDFVLGGTPNGALFSLWFCNAVLPTEWLDFSSELLDEQSVELTWTTATEINNDFFTVERSQDGQTWQAIGQVDGAGNSDVPQTYIFEDLQPQVGENHYRIRQTSLDGGTTASDVETQTITATQGIHISPNPAHNEVQIDMAGIESATVTLRNQLGQQVFAPQTVGVNQLILRTQELPRGIYYLEVKRDAKTVSQKLILE
jgi:Secretion system C-terminal sorting domain